MYQSVREDFINDYVTIDMMTGQHVQLDDLLEVNEDFVGIQLRYVVFR